MQIHKIIHYLRRFTGFPRDIKLLLFYSSIVLIGFGLSNVVMSLYLKSLGYNPSTIGILFSISTITSTLLTIPGGLLADHYGKKKTLLVSTIAYLLSFIFYAAFTNFYLLCFASFLNGISFGTYNAPFIALLTERTHHEKRSYVFSFNSFIMNFSMIVGNLLAGTADILRSKLRFSTSFSYRIFFGVGVVFVLISILPLVLMEEDTSYIKKRTKVLNIKSWQVIWMFSIVNALIGFGAGFFIPLLPLYLNLRFHVSSAYIAVLLAASNVMMGIAYLASPRVVELIGNVKTVTLTQGLSVIPLLLIPTSQNFAIAAFLYTIRSVLMNMSHPVFTSYMMGAVSKEERASVAGITSTAWNGSTAISTIISGYIMNRLVNIPIYLCGVFYILSTTLFYIFFKTHEIQ